MSLGKSGSLSKFVFWPINKKVKSSQHLCEYPLCSFDAPLFLFFDLYSLSFSLPSLGFLILPYLNVQRLAIFSILFFSSPFSLLQTSWPSAVSPVLCTSEIRVDVCPMGENSLLNEYVAAFLDWRSSFQV